jgi:hypothetical protein
MRAILHGKAARSCIQGKEDPEKTRDMEPKEMKEDEKRERPPGAGPTSSSFLLAFFGSFG